MAPTIREARPGDEPAIHEAHMRSIREVCVRDHGPEEVRGWGNRELGDRWKEAVLAGHVWVVEDGGAIRGVGYLRIDADKPACLHALYLTPEVLGKGLGSRLIELITERARARGVKTILLDSTITARGFYRKHGFAETGPKRREEIGGSPVTCFPMAKELQPPLP